MTRKTDADITMEDAFDIKRGLMVNYTEPRMDDFTPGPWKVVFSESKPTRIVCGDGSTTANILYLSLIKRKTPNESEANANLIAAAPDMYKACKMALTVTGGSKKWEGLTHDFLVEVEKAVAKAEGRREV